MGGDDPDLAAPPLLTAARTKSRLFLEFVEDQDEGASPSLPVVLDYNNLRTLIGEVAPKLAAALPPEIPIAAQPPVDLDGHFCMVTYSELRFFCRQIADYLE